MRSNDGADDKSVKFLYGTRFGRLLLGVLLALKVPAILGLFLRSRLSVFYIKPFIKKNNISMTGFEGQKYKCFNDFFTRKKNSVSFDSDYTHFISPCDSLLSVYDINDDSVFHVKGSDYRLTDFLQGSDIGRIYSGGKCLIFRLCATDYHRYCYVDDGFLDDNHFIPGKLYSVQSSACENYKVYTLNRRNWALMYTKNFGTLAQIEVGAFSVGGICNHHQGYTFKKGEEKGYFDLHGSTIVILCEKDKLKLTDEVAQGTKDGKEYRVKYGEQIGYKA